MSAGDAHTLALGFPLEPWRLGPSLAHGPGRRVPLFLSGCSLRCTEVCLSPHLLEVNERLRYPVDQVVAALLRAARAGPAPVEGVTVLGGEPTDQALALTRLCRALRGEGLSTMVYTGHTLEALRGSLGPRADGLLEEVDLLVDGPFVAERYDPRLAWRGSSNQRLLCVGERYTPEDLERAWTRQRKAFSIRGDPAGGLTLTGLQSRGSARRVEQALETE